MLLLGLLEISVSCFPHLLSRWRVCSHLQQGADLGPDDQLKKALWIVINCPSIPYTYLGRRTSKWNNYLPLKPPSTLPRRAFSSISAMHPYYNHHTQGHFSHTEKNKPSSQITSSALLPKLFKGSSWSPHPSVSVCPLSPVSACTHHSLIGSLNNIFSSPYYHNVRMYFLCPTSRSMLTPAR